MSPEKQMILSDIQWVKIDYRNKAALTFDFRESNSFTQRYRNYIKFRPNIDTLQDIADRLRELADKFELRAKKHEP